MFVVSLMPGGAALAHPADEFPQVTLQINIDDQAVDLIVGIPAETAMLDVFDGMTPVAMDQMEPEDLAKVIAPIFAERCPVKIDDVTVPPTILQPVVQMENSRQPARRFPVAQTLEQGTLKFVARYETKGKPARVSLDWSIYSNLYDDDTNEPIYEDDLLLVAALLVAEGRESFVFFMPFERAYTWHSQDAPPLPADLLASTPAEPDKLSVPLPSIALVLAGLVCGGITLKQSKPRAAGVLVFSLVTAWVCLPYGGVEIERGPSYTALDDDDALAVFESLHRNIYRAFDYTDEGAVYDALAQSVDGPMLETIYNDVYQSLIMRDHNGAVTKVVRVRIDEAELTDHSDSAGSTPPGEEPGSYVVRASWQVDGLVTHFGHTHTRTNAFEAVYTIAPRADGWRIVESDIINQERIDDGYQSAQDIYDDP